MNVPIKGQKRDTLHLIDEDLAMRVSAERKDPALPPGAGDKAGRRLLPVPRPDSESRTTLGTSANLQACEQAKTLWVQATSREGEGVEAYKIDFARDPDAFPSPKWPTQSLDDLIETTFAGRMIDQRGPPGSVALDRRQAVGVMSENFANVVVCDFEYEVADGDLPNVLCMVAYVLDENLQHVRTIRMWRGEFGTTPPFDIGPDTLFVAYSAWAEMTCFMMLGWKFPEHIFDLHTAYLAASKSCCRTTPTRCASGRASACPTPAAPTGSKVGSASTRTTIAKDIGEGRWREYGRERVFEYCEEDVRMSTQLLRAQLRGRATDYRRCRRRARAALVELQRQGGRADPGARHADRHAAVESGAGEQGRRDRRAAAAIRSELRQRRSDLHARRRMELRALRAMARAAPA